MAEPEGDRRRETGAAGRDGQGNPGGRGVVMPLGSRAATARSAAESLPAEQRDPALPESEESFLDARPRDAPFQGMLPLPQRRRKRSRALLFSFLLCVLLPTIVVGIYYYGFAADQYVAEFRFAVTESTPALPGMPPSTSQGGSLPLLGGLAQMVGSSGASMQNYVVIDYLLSRQAVDALEKRIGLRAIYARSQSDRDPWAGFPARKSMEGFVGYWQDMASASYDPMTGLAVARVRAYTPQDARLIAETMVQLSEELVNTIARRPQLDAVRSAEAELRRAEERMTQARTALTEFRFREGVIDPSGNVSGNVDLVKALRLQLAQLQTDLAALGNQQANVNAPAAQTLRSRISATRDQLTKVEREVSKDREGNRVLAELVGRFEQLDLERQYAQAMLMSTMQALDQARASASAQHLYLTPYVRPVEPESAGFPKRAQSTALAGLALLGVWVVGVMLVRSIAEHL